MSFTLTDRDTGTKTLTVGSADTKGITYSVAGGLSSDFMVAKARHEGLTGKVTSNSRHNFRLERRKVNATLQSKVMSVDITISVPNDGTFAADDVDDLVTLARDYFSSEAETLNFITGVNRS